ncbi:unnamed protein product [Owenia fusiformis]|uniref:Uncharacterized protein n=1 Tax=Owenia fusiformis TaxID=6347 RepID=A0A8J1U573_OWEFU|nr:unnamed protein product [Owenia fusiformis]
MNSMLRMNSKRTLILGLILIVLCGLFFTRSTERFFVYYQKPCGDTTYRNSASDKGIKYERQPKLILDETFKHHFIIDGAIFSDKGMALSVPKNISTSLVYSFSPSVEQTAKKMYILNGRDNKFYANSPAILWFKGRLFTTLRIWLQNEAFDLAKKWPANVFQDNAIFTQQFDKFMRPLTNGSLVGMITPKWKIGDGPIEPRLFTFRNRLLMTFNTGYVSSLNKMRDFSFIWDMESNVLIRPRIKGPKPQSQTRDKHWIPFIKNNKLYFVHGFDPLRILKCQLGADACDCHFVMLRGNLSAIFSNVKTPLRGGTPMEKYKGSYYISIMHATLFKKATGLRFYTFNLVVFCTTPKPRIVYVSGPIEVNPDLLKRYPIVRHWYIEEPFVFPVGLLLEGKDSVIIGGHINDHSSVLLRLTGLQAIMKTVISIDQENFKPKRGPPDFTVQAYVKDAATKYSGIQFH